MRLSVRHLTSYSYDPPADRVSLRLRLWPVAHDGQAVADWQVSVNGQPVRPVSTDAWGRAVGLWQTAEPADAIAIEAQGVVTTQDRAGVVKGLPVRPPDQVWLRETPLTGASEAVAEFAAGIVAQDRLAWLHALCAAVGEAVVYRPRATASGTSAAQALEQGAGVCQDHAHLFIAAARVSGIPARYVVGYMMAEEGEAAEVETHAWAEASVPGLGWIGFDPTNAICPTERYVRLGCGLDAHDAAPVQGAVMGPSEISVEAEVEIGPAGQSQSQSQSQAQ
jgi:transglutaminase-like putative cysteine protease